MNFWLLIFTKISEDTFKSKTGLCYQPCWYCLSLCQPCTELRLSNAVLMTINHTLQCTMSHSGQLHVPEKHTSKADFSSIQHFSRNVTKPHSLANCPRSSSHQEQQRQLGVFLTSRRYWQILQDIFHCDNWSTSSIQRVETTDTSKCPATHRISLQITMSYSAQYHYRDSETLQYLSTSNLL